MYKIQLLLIAIILIVSTNTKLNAQLKVKDSSEKKQPEWILNQEQGYIVSKGSGITMDEAKSKVIEAVKKTIKSDAINLMLNENIYLKSLELNEQIVSDMFESLDYYVNIKVENLPAGRQGSTSFYWEFILNKKTKEKIYDYYLKYPYKSTDMVEIVNQIADVKISEKLDIIQHQFSYFKSIEELSNVWKELMYLSPFIPDESKHKLKIENLMTQLETTFSQIEITTNRHIHGFLVVYLILNEKVLEISTPPIIKSDCAKILKTNSSIDKWEIMYSYEKCRSNKPLVFTLEFNSGFNKISKDFELNTNDEILDVKISDRDILLLGRDLRFFVSTRYRGNLIIERIVIRYNDLNFTDTPMRQVLDGAGLYDITFSLPPDFHVVKVNDKVRGELYYKSEKTGQTGVCRFYNHSIKKE